MKKKYFTLMQAITLFITLSFSGMLNAASEYILGSADDPTSEGWTWSWNGAATKVANPLKNSVNGNTNVWKFVPTQQWGGFCTGDDAGLGIDFQTYSTFECMVYCPEATKPIKILIEAEGAGEMDLGLINCSGGWAIATGSVEAWNSAAATKFAIKNGDNTEAGMAIYFDNIKFIDPSGIPAKIVDNGETVTNAWDWSWGGVQNQVSHVENPVKDAVNTSDRVIKITPTAEWGGLSFGINGSTVDGEYDLGAYSQFEMMIYCPGLSTLQLMVGINDADGGANFDVLEDCSAGWVKVTQDVSSWAGNSSNKFFIKNGEGTTGIPIYIDNIQFVNPNIPMGIEQGEINVNAGVFYNGNDIIVNAEQNFSYALYNLTGSLLIQGKSNAPTGNINAQMLPTGIYIVKLDIAGKQISKKISVY